MRTIPVWRIAATAIGCSAAGLGCWGAWQFAKGLEGGQVTYLVVAAPIVAATAALIPPLAEHQWKLGERLRSLLWWLVLIPAAAVVFLSAFERVHYAKAGAQADRTSLQRNAQRADAALTTAKAALVAAENAEAEAAGALVTMRSRAVSAEAATKARRPRCDDICHTLAASARADAAKAEASGNRARAHADAARASIVAAENALRKAEAAATEDAPVGVPAWLLPLALDLVGFMGIWTAASPAAPVVAKPPAAKVVRGQAAKTPRKRKSRAKAQTKPPTVPLRNIPDANRLRLVVKSAANS